MQRVADIFWRCCTVFWWCAFLVFLLATCCPANAAPPRVLYLTDAGYRTLEIDDQGEPQNVPFDTVLDLRSGDNPDPDPPPDPDDPEPEPDPDALTKKVKSWAEAVGDPQTAQKLELVYLQIAQSVGAGDLDLETGPVALSAAGDSVATSKWDSFRESIGDEFRMRRQRSIISSKADFVQFLEAVASGLRLSADDSVAISNKALLKVVSQVNTAIDGARE